MTAKFLLKIVMAFSLPITSSLFVACNNNEDTEDIHETSENKDNFNPTGNVNGHEYVDLGLSVSWATCNIGATKPWEEGYSYFWGDPNGILNFETASTYSFPEPPINGSIYDIARKQYGTEWSLPSFSETEELTDKCTIVEYKYKNVDGFKITGPNGNSIFLPSVNLEYSLTSPFEVNSDIYCLYMFSGEKFTYNKGKSENLYSYQIDKTSGKYGSFGWRLNICDSHKLAVRAVTKKGATGSIDKGNNSGSTGNDNGSTGGSNTGGSTSYEKPDIAFNDFTAYQTKLKVVYKIYNSDKAKVTSAKVYYGTSSNPTKSVTATVAGVLITANIAGLQKGTTYYVKCVATGKGGTTTTGTTKLTTNY